MTNSKMSSRMQTTTKRLLACATGLVLVIGLMGCHTMHFANTSGQPSGEDFSEWHHGGILRLVEFSSPVDLDDRCDGNPWTSATVERSFVNGLASSISYGLYDAWTVKIDCE